MSGHSVIRFSERGNPRRYTIPLNTAPMSNFHQHMLDSISNRHIRFRPRQRRNAMLPGALLDAPPNLLNIIDELMNTKKVVDTIPVYTAEDVISDCTICQESINKGDQFRRLPCGVTVNHCFHKDCIDPWLSRNNTCPNCRSNLTQ
jgi:hypothetical protein